MTSLERYHYRVDNGLCTVCGEKIDSGRRCRICAQIKKLKAQEYRKTWTEERKQKLSEYQKEWWKNHPEAKNKYRKRRKEKKKNAVMRSLLDSNIS